jgi:hypothetical protein
VVRQASQDFLWIADNGSKTRRTPDGVYARDAVPSRAAVAMYSLDGDEVLRLPKPDLEIYTTERYSPTQVAVDEERFGGSGDIWVTDGYGQMVVHCFDRNGAYRFTIDGAAGAGTFSEPHSVFIDRRAGSPELYVADRGNRRIQAFAPE